MEKNEGLVPDNENHADFTGFSEDQSNKAIEGGVGEIKIVVSNNPRVIKKKQNKVITIFAGKKVKDS